MPEFGDMFMESKGEPIAYEGRKIVMLDRYPARLGQRLLVTIESTDSPWPQGVGISEGVRVFGERDKAVVVWEYSSIDPDRREEERSSLPWSFEVECRNKQGFLSFYNMTEFKGRHEWWTRGHALFVEELENGRRYNCNDFAPDDDFNDLIFTVTEL